MVKVAPEDPSSSTGTCLVSALSWLNNCFFLAGVASLTPEMTSSAGRATAAVEGKLERYQSFLGISKYGEDVLLPGIFMRL